MEKPELSDLLGIAKLAETLGRGIGWYLEPQQIRRLAAATSEATVEIERGKQEALTIAQRAEYRRKLESIREQRNLESIIAVAAEALPSSEQLSAQPVEEDWTAQFCDSARMQSDQYLRELWGRLLAGEITAPGSYSKRTLNVLMSLSRREAELFAAAGTYVWEFDDEALALAHTRTFGIAQDVVRTMQDSGLFAFGPHQGRQQVFFRSENPMHLRYCENKYVAVPKLGVGQRDVLAIRLTKAGRELVSISESKPDKTFEEECLQLLDQIGLEVRRTS